jgi:hypothetical protein
MSADRMPQTALLPLIAAIILLPNLPFSGLQSLWSTCVVAVQSNSAHQPLQIHGVGFRCWSDRSTLVKFH